MYDIPTNNYIAHLTRIIEDQENPLTSLLKSYLEFLRFATRKIQQRKFPRLVVKLFKEIKQGDDPRGLRVGELAYALNMA